MRARLIIVWIVLAALGGVGFAAEDLNAPAAMETEVPRLQLAQTETRPSAQAPAVPDAAKLAILIRSTIIALNQANRTDNYTVLHSLGAPGFQQGNSPERLGELFAGLRARDLDLGPITVINPQLFRQPFIDERGRLRLTGFFPSRPEQVNFDLAFEFVDEEWRLFGIGVNTSREEPVAANGQAQ